MASVAAKELAELCPPRRESELPPLRENAGPNGKQLRSKSPAMHEFDTQLKDNFS